MADLARLNVVLSDLSEILENGGLEEHSKVAINTMKEKKQYGDLLDLFESFMESMAFIDHDACCSLLLEGWKKYMNVVSAERKVAVSKYDAIKDDKKADPDKITLLQSNVDAAGVKRGQCMGALIRLKAMDSISSKEFINNPNYDIPTAIAAFDEKVEPGWTKM
jgi:hypothetical protein